MIVDDKYLNMSSVYMQKGQFEKAQIILRHALNENPNHAKALEFSGDLALKLGRNEEAIQHYDHASSNYANNHQYAEAIICLEKIVQMDRADGEIFERLADLYSSYGLPNRGIDTLLELCARAMGNREEEVLISGLRKILASQTRNLALQLSFAKILASLDRTQEADDELKGLKSLAEELNDENILEEIKKLMPQKDGGEELDPKSRVELGNLLYEIGSKDEALVEFDKAVSDLIESNEIEEALAVLNRIIEIDPDNTKAHDKINELQGQKPAKAADEKAVSDEVSEPEAVADEVTQEASEQRIEEGVQETMPEKGAKEEAPETVGETASQAPEEALDMFQDLREEIEGFIPATEPGEGEEAAEVDTGKEPTEKEVEEAAQMEGQIADIEFLLKETEEPAAPSFDIAKEFDEFRTAITWQEEDTARILDLAKMAFQAGLYATALNYVTDIKVNKKTWPLSLEINGGSLVRLGRYNEAMKALAPSLLLEEIPEDKKIELRYLLAAAYEGMGDFDNALREIEHIMNAEPDYKDIKEIYALLTGKELVHEERREVVEEKPVIAESVAPPPPPEPVPPVDLEEHREVLPEEGYPTVIEEKTPSVPQEKVTEKPREEEPEVEEEKGENITFL